MNEAQLSEAMEQASPAAFVFTDLLKGAGKYAEVAIVSPRYVKGANLDYGNSVELRGYGTLHSLWAYGTLHVGYKLDALRREMCLRPLWVCVRRADLLRAHWRLDTKQRLLLTDHVLSASVSSLNHGAFLNASIAPTLKELKRDKSKKRGRDANPRNARA